MNSQMILFKWSTNRYVVEGGNFDSYTFEPVIWVYILSQVSQMSQIQNVEGNRSSGLDGSKITKDVNEYNIMLYNLVYHCKIYFL